MFVRTSWWGLRGPAVTVRVRAPPRAACCVRCGVGVLPCGAVQYNGWTPAHHAAYEGKDACLRLLIEAGSDLTAKTKARAEGGRGTGGSVQ